MLCADDEFGAEVYSGATNEKQAWEVFKPAKLMVQRLEPLAKRFKIQLLAATLLRPADGSKFETIVGDPGDGQSPSCAIHDEYHEHVDDGQVDTMLTGMGARSQPLQLLITTAGENLAGPCYAMILEEREKLAGIGHNGGPPLHDTTFFAEYAADEDDDWKLPATLHKANPNIGVSVSLEYLLAQQRDAIERPRKRGIFKTKHLNQWVAAKAAFFDIEAWRRCADPDMPVRFIEAEQLEALQGRRCIISLDLASKVDIAAIEYLFLPIGDRATPDDPYIRLGRYFLPNRAVEDNKSYQGWHAQGLLDVCEGNITDYEEIEVAIDEALVRFDVEQVAYDPMQATMLVTRLMKKNVPVLEMRATVFNFSDPMKQLDAFTRAGLIRHAGCPVMEWEMNNVVAQLDAKDNVYPRKPRAEAKIDSPVALIAAFAVALAGQEKDNGMDDYLAAMRGRKRVNFGRKMRRAVKTVLSLLDPRGWSGVLSEGSTSGKNVNAGNALTLSTVWACTRLVAGTISSLPLVVYKDGANDTKVRFKDHPLYGLLQQSPNADQTALDFWQFVCVSLELWGNAFARIERGAGKRIVALTPIRPELVQVRRVTDGTIRYRYPDGGKSIEIGQDEMFHVRGFGGSPLGGLSTLSFGRQSFGLALATDEAAAQVYKNGLRSSGVLTTKDNQTLKKEQRDDIYKYVVEPFMGDNNGKPMVLEAGLEWKSIQLSSVDAQMIQSRQFSVEDGCRWFGVPPHMVGHTSNSTSWGSGLENQTLGFLIFTLRERLKRIEQAIMKQLLTAAERLTITVEFNFEGLLRADSAARAAFYAQMVQNGIMTRNEVRRLENLPPIDGGDDLTIQSNMIPVSKLGEVTSTGGEAARRSIMDWLFPEGLPAKSALYEKEDA